MRKIHLNITMLALAVIMVNVSILSRQRKTSKRIETLEQRCDSLQKQIDFMAE